MLSGFVKSQYEELQSMLKAMGAEVTSQAKHATHLIMPKMCRTISFLCAMSYVKWILKPEWITDSHKEKKLIGMYAFFYISNDGSVPLKHAQPNGPECHNLASYQIGFAKNCSKTPKLPLK